jgi:methionyl-tRNA formyltransferase
VRLVFLGTPEFAVPTLEALVPSHEIALVVAQPDKPAGRGMKVQSPAVAVKARELGIALLQPAKIRNEEFLERIRELRPDLGIVVAYGKILPAALLDIPRYGFLNVHASILPRYRGAAPIQRAIEHGERETGVTIMRVDVDLDHGPKLAIERTAIGPDEHTPQLAARLSHLGASALASVLGNYGDVIETPQDHAAATLAPKIEKGEGLVHWNEPAGVIYDKFRAFDPWPGLTAGDLKLIDIRPAGGGGAPGTILAIADDGVVVAAGDEALRLISVQRAGKSRVSAVELARSGWRVGSVLQ